MKSNNIRKIKKQVYSNIQGYLSCYSAQAGKVENKKNKKS